MPDNVIPSVLTFDDEHRRVLYVEGRVVGWTGTRAEYHWRIMSAPLLNRDQIFFLEAEPVPGYEPFAYRGDAVAALRSYAVRAHLHVVDPSDATVRFETGYSDALEQEIRELQAQCRHIRLSRHTQALLARLATYESTLAHLRTLLTDHFAGQQAAWERLQSLLQCCATDDHDAA